jgi:putative DNA primase/helicase
MEDMLNWALAYCDAGYSVIPLHGIDAKGNCTCGNETCDRAGKHPSISKWKDLQENPWGIKEITKHWKSNPLHNIGIIAGKRSGFNVIDLDGEEGEKSAFAKGIVPREWNGPVSWTGGGGYHLFSQISEIRTSVRSLPGVDIRSEGSYVVVPPSMHKSGKRYRWLEGKNLFETELQDIDVVSLIESKDVIHVSMNGNGSNWYVKLLEGVSEGKRNDALARLAGRRLAKGDTLDEAIMFLETWNIRNDPPMELEELHATIKSIYNKEKSSDIVTLDREDMLDHISKVMKTPLRGVLRLSGDDPKYVLQFDKGTTTITSAQLLKPDQLQRAILDATNVVMTKLSNKPNSVPTHDGLVQLICNVSVLVDSGEEATGLGELLGILKEMIRYEKLPEQNLTEVPLSGSFYSEDKLWVSNRDLVQKANSLGSRFTLKEMAQTLRKHNFEHKTFYTELGQRTVWGISTKRLGLECVISE